MVLFPFFMPSDRPRDLRSGPLRIVYLLEDTPLFGGVKVILRQADELAGRGHDVKIVSPGARPGWYEPRAEFVRTTGLEPHEIPPADVTVASYWTTIEKALKGAGGEVVHYCQGFEGIYTHNEAEHSKIDAAYQTPVPAFAVSEHLAQMVRQRYGRPARVVPQPLESSWQSRWRWRPGRPARILVMSPLEIDWKGVETSLRALALLRERGLDFRAVRLSQWPLSDAERAILEPDEFHEHLPPTEVPALVRSCDLLLAASWEQEGFGLPVLEAMASGVPAIVSDISCFRDWTGNAAVRVPFDAPEAFANATERLLGSSRRWRRARRRGLRIARGFRADVAGAEAEAAMRWVASGEWRTEMRPEASIEP